MDKEKVFINANLASLRVQVDAIVSTFDITSKNKYEKYLIDSIQNLYDNFENQFNEEEFELFKNLVKEMSLRP